MNTKLLLYMPSVITANVSNAAPFILSQTLGGDTNEILAAKSAAWPEGPPRHLRVTPGPLLTAEQNRTKPHGPEERGGLHFPWMFTDVTRHSASKAFKMAEEKVTGAASNRTSSVPTDGKIWPVIVIGGGVSGLTTAGMLASRGVDVLVLEAKNHVHGRTFTHQFFGTPKLPAAAVDLGANYIHGAGKGQPIYQLAQKLGINAPIANNAFWMDTSTARWFDKDTAEEVPIDTIARLHLLEGRIWQLIDQVPRSLRQHFDLFQTFRIGQRVILEEDPKKLTPMEEGILDAIRIKGHGYVSDFSEMGGSEEPDPEDPVPSNDTLLQAMRSASRFLEPMAQADIDRWKMHMKTKLKMASMPHPPSPSEEGVLGVQREGGSADRLNVDGYRWLVDYLKGRIPEGHIIVNRPAQAVEVTPSGLVRVQVQDPQGNSVQQFFGNRVVVTVPLGVLKGTDSRSKISFSPPLSSSHSDAISKGGMGTHNKVVLRFDTTVKFWPNVGNFLSSDSRFHWMNLDYYGQHGTLVAHIFPPYAYDMLHVSDEHILREVLSNLRGMFREISNPEQFLIVKWNAEPFALGSYSFTPKGTDDNLREAFFYPHPSEADSRVIFAGEHTVIGNQCVTSAYHSALRAGNCLLGQVYGKDPAPDDQFPLSSQNHQCPWSTQAPHDQSVKVMHVQATLTKLTKHIAQESFMDRGVQV